MKGYVIAVVVLFGLGVAVFVGVAGAGINPVFAWMGAFSVMAFGGLGLNFIHYNYAQKDKAK